MNRAPRLTSPTGRWALLALALALSAPAANAEGFSLSFSRVIGGPLDADDPDPGLGNLGYQLGFGFDTAPKTRVMLRVGEIDFEGELFGPFIEPDLTYATLGGEYLFDAGFYRSGLFLGLGGYRLRGPVLGGGDDQDQTALGLTLGATGHFPLTQRFSTVVELTGHYTDLDASGSQLYAFLTVGFGFDF
jgi:hypothetical protein